MPESTKTLSHELCELAGEKHNHVVFSNSGAETAEAATKVVRTKTGRVNILSTVNSVHGKTHSALSATGLTKCSSPATVDNHSFMKMPFNDIEALKSELSSKKHAAFVVEPVQGEGGVVIANEEFLQAAEEARAATGALFVLDETQTGLGRAGHLFAKDACNVAPDMVLLSKALGGGVHPVGAVVAKASACSKEFDKKHSSTFAGAGLGASVALATPEPLTKLECDSSFLGSAIIGNVQGTSHCINDLAKRHPRTISSRGTGLMWSLNFEDTEDQAVGNTVSTVINKTALSHLVCGFLLNERQILVVPFLGDENSVRFEPPLTISPRETMQFINAIEEVCKTLKNQRHDMSLSCLTDRETDDGEIDVPFIQKKMTPQSISPRPNEKPRRKFAFFAHLLDANDTMKQLPKSMLATHSTGEQQKLAELIHEKG